MVSTDNGQVTITVPALVNLIHRTTLKLDNVDENKIKIRCLPQGVAIYLEVSIQPDQNVPEVTQLLQNTVRQDVETMVGLHVAEVRVVVAAIAKPASAQTKNSRFV